jgi:hypothetical protein
VNSFQFCLEYSVLHVYMMNRRLGSVTILCILVGFLTFLCSCQPNGNEKKTSSETPETSSQMTAVSSSTPSPQPENTALPSNPGNFTASLAEKLAAAPDIEGAVKVTGMVNGLERVLYQAKPDNPYGLPAQASLGEYKYEVLLGETRTGGVALAAPAAGRYLQQALDSLPSGQPRWLLTLPLDLTDCRSLRPVRIDLSAEPFINRPYYVRIAAENEELGVVNILNQQQAVEIGSFNMYDRSYVISKTSLNSMRIIEGQEMAFLFVIVKFAQSPKADSVNAYGDRIGLTTEPVLAGLSSVRGPLRVHDYDCILKISGCPVFLMANRETK